MKISRKIVISVVIGITILLAVAIIVPVVFYYKQKTIIYDDPIIIWSDEDFALYDFPGTGNEQDPYVLENLRINTTLETGIFIKYTSKYFIVRNCHIAAQSIGIHLDSITSGTAIVANNTIVDYEHAGILIERTNQITIANNLCYENRNEVKSSGIHLYYSDFATIKDNFCSDNHVGLSIETSHGGFIYNNTIYRNDLHGIRFYQSTNSTILYNKISINIFGIVMYHNSNSNTFSYNLIQYCILGGIWINPWLNPQEPLPSYNVFHHNSFMENLVAVGAYQAVDNGYNNTWFDVKTNEGNWYSDYIGFGSYLIQGTAYAEDPYPLDFRPVCLK